MAKRQKTTNLRALSHPVLYEVNARVLIHELSAAEGKRVTLATIPEGVIEEWARLGLDAVWLMGVWSTGTVGLKMAREYEPLHEEYLKALPDFTPDDVISSPYAVSLYTVSSTLGGNAALQTLRKRLAARGIGLVLDFVCNHTARDHEWVNRHPEYYIAGLPGDETSKAEIYFKAKTAKGQRVLAYGRDPTYPGWRDTAQLNFAHPGVRRAMIGILGKLSTMCDGVRCDMAMLLLRKVFERTWGDRAKLEKGPSAHGEFWKEAIDSVRNASPEFLFIAEAYWNLEWELQQLGFDYTYDKILFDRLLREGATSVREHLKAEMGFQKHCVRFIENHDEPRAAKALPSEPWHYAAATVIATVPGMALFHDGQFEGRSVKIPVQLKRRPVEPVSLRTKSFYTRLLSCINNPVFQKGTWTLLGVRPGWHDNPTWQNFLAFWWKGVSSGARLVIVNYAPLSGQCYVDIPLDQINGPPYEFRDLMGEAVYARERAGISAKGMYFDLPPYGLHIFEVTSGRKPLH